MHFNLHRPLDDLYNNIPDFSLSSSFEENQDYGSSTHFEFEMILDEKDSSINSNIQSRAVKDSDPKVNKISSRAAETICSVKQLSTSPKFSIRKHLKTSNFSKAH